MESGVDDSPHYALQVSASCLPFPGYSNLITRSLLVLSENIAQFGLEQNEVSVTALLIEKHGDMGIF